VGPESVVGIKGAASVLTYRFVSAGLAAWCALGTFVLTNAQQADMPKIEQTIQGTWRLVGFEQNGNEIPVDQGQDRTIFFGGGAFVVRDGFTMRQAGTIAVDTSTSPKSITMIIGQGEDQNKSFLGIYAIEKDTLKLCLDRRGQNRPEKFETDDKSDRTLATYTRVFAIDLGAIEIAGTYTEETPDANGNMHQLEVTIERRGDVYQLTWKVQGQVAYAGTGIRKGDVLSVCWISQGQVGLSVLRIEKGPKLTGHYTMLGSSGALVPETMLPAAKSVVPPKNAADAE
jgi:uncharacterized protein (TIGR03067 family)